MSSISIDRRTRRISHRSKLNDSFEIVEILVDRTFDNGKARKLRNSLWSGQIGNVTDFLNSQDGTLNDFLFSELVSVVR